ncbi:hypothetical protein Agabi119p4_10573 [Agaricus bisporus var. burnettii]|uniref:HAT C-terminal dimerisation domain-containing protein n=1 Tax=Agaricus bisporus var. burnettii TaxID=192524 RepID=A0A8H7C3Y1_AGABI|nr:hypothetical protein Agabi119p4_10573 [Agaricus bisporus var. burnettii]
MAVTVQYEKEGQIVSWLLDIRELDKILGVTCDNTTNNDVMVENMGVEVEDFDGDASHLYSESAHKTQKKQRADEVYDAQDVETDEEEENDNDVDHTLAGGNERLAGDLATIRQLAGMLERQQQRARLEEAPEETANDLEDIGWIDERWSMSEDKLENLTQSVMPARQMLVKLRKIVFAVKNSPTVIAPRWNEICVAKGLSKRHIPTQAIDALTSERSLKLRAYEMDSEEWEIATELCKVLKIFKDATLFFSKASTSTITAVIPAMDHFDEVLTTTGDSPAVPPSIRVTIHQGLQTLNRYYNKTDHSKIYRVAMVLDPHYKMAYFRRLKWEEDWIKTAVDLVKTEFAIYASLEIDVEENNDIHSALLDNPQLSFEVEESLNMFESFIMGGPAISTLSATVPVLDEVKLYLSTGPETLKYMDHGQEKSFTPLEWWVNHRGTYPRLSCMALDYLSVPGECYEFTNL